MFVIGKIGIDQTRGDDVFDVPVYVARRRMMKMEPPTVYLPAEAFTLDATATWTSPHTGAAYPAGWRITVTPPGGAPFTFTATRSGLLTSAVGATWSVAGEMGSGTAPAARTTCSTS